MENSDKFAWTWSIKEEFLERYVELHLNPWPEIMEEHSRAGIRCNRWNAITSKMVEGSFDFNEDEPIKPMREVFFLK